MIEIEINPARIIRETRENKEAFTISSREMDYVAAHPALCASEKLIWLMIAKHSAQDPHLSSTLMQQEIAAMVAIKTEAVLPYLHRLEAMGFIKINIDAGEILDCSLVLPLTGLLALKKAPIRKKDNRRSSSRYFEGKGMISDEGLHSYK